MYIHMFLLIYLLNAITVILVCKIKMAEIEVNILVLKLEAQSYTPSNNASLSIVILHY